MNNSDVLFCIFNYRHAKNSERLYKLIHRDFNCFILDSKSDERPDAMNGDTKYFDNIYYGGLYNAAVRFTNDMHCKYLFFICGDVIMDKRNYMVLRDVLLNEDFSDVGVYAPSHMASSFTLFKSGYCKGTFAKREVAAIEGILSLINIEVLNGAFPCEYNKHGWGIDGVVAYLAKKQGLKIFVDDRIQIYHPKGTGYNSEEAMNLSRIYREKLGNEINRGCLDCIREAVKY